MRIEPGTSRLRGNDLNHYTTATTKISVDNKVYFRKNQGLLMTPLRISAQFARRKHSRTMRLKIVEQKFWVTIPKQRWVRSTRFVKTIFKDTRLLSSLGFKVLNYFRHQHRFNANYLLLHHVHICGTAFFH